MLAFMEPTSHLRLLGGTARMSDLLEAGHTKASIVRAVHAGEITRFKTGLVALPDADPQVRHAVSNRGLITCASAVRELGLWGLKEPEQLHLWVPHGRPLNAVRHRSRLAGNRIPGAYAPVLDVVLHALRCRPPLEALIIAESAVTKRKVRMQDLLEHSSGPRNGPSRSILKRITCTAESPLEVIARELFIRAGLRVQAQVYFEGIGRVDLLVESRIIVELDGFDFHWTRPEFRKDRRRNNAGVLRGLVTLRYIYEDLVFEPDRVVAEVLAMARQLN